MGRRGTSRGRNSPRPMGLSISTDALRPWVRCGNVSGITDTQGAGIGAGLARPGMIPAGNRIGRE